MTNPGETNAWQTPSIEPITGTGATSGQDMAPVRNGAIIGDSRDL